MNNELISSFAYQFCNELSNLDTFNSSFEDFITKSDYFKPFDGSIYMYERSILYQKCLFLKHTSTTIVEVIFKLDLNIVKTSDKFVIMVLNDGIYQPIIGSSCYLINWVTFDKLIKENYSFSVHEPFAINRICKNKLIQNEENGSCLLYYNGAIHKIVENKKEKMYFLKDGNLYFINNSFQVETKKVNEKKIEKKRKIEIISQLLRMHFICQGCYKIIPRVANNICAKWLPEKTKIETILRKIAKENSKMYIWTLHEIDIQEWKTYSLFEIQILVDMHK